MIRTVKPADAALMYAAMKQSFKDLKRWMPWAQTLASLRDTEMYLAHGERLWQSQVLDGVELPLQIMDPSDQYYIGATGIKPANLTIPSFEVGYWVNRKYAGQGLITEAMNALSHFLFDYIKAKRVEINCEVANQRSALVAERLNYQLEGTLRNQRMMADGKTVTDSLIYSCLNPNTLPPIDYQCDEP